MQHPQAVRDRLYEESKRPSPWTPRLIYRIILKRRDGGTEFRGRVGSREEARESIARHFEFDVEDVYSHAWFVEEVRL